MPSSSYSNYINQSGVLPVQLPMHTYYKNNLPIPGMNAPPPGINSLSPGINTRSPMLFPLAMRGQAYNGAIGSVRLPAQVQQMNNLRTNVRNFQANNDIMSNSMHTSQSNYYYLPSNVTPGVNIPHAYNDLSKHTYVTPVNHGPNNNASNNAYLNNKKNPVINKNALPTNLRHAETGNSNNNKRSAIITRYTWKERAHVGKYSLIKTIGKGNFAKVKLAEHLTTGMQVDFVYKNYL